MTNEEAINILYGIKADNLNLEDLYTKSKYDALGMAIKALEQEPCEDAELKDIFCMGCEYKEQEPILDKVLGDIKTEIEECWQMYEDRFDVGDCLDIIDKYRAESEGL